MLNYKLSTIFASLAEMSKNIDGGFSNVMDLTRAARTIRDYTRDIEKAYHEGAVPALPGITEGIYSLIEEYFKTGRIKDYEILKERYSEDLIKFIRISGLGKKRIFHIYDTLGAKNLDDLKQAISDGSIYDLAVDKVLPDKDFINRIHIERFIYSLHYFENIKNLFPAGYVDFFIDRVQSGFLKLKEIEKIQLTGSLRRKKSFIRDIDILILPGFNKEKYDFTRSEELLKKISGLSFIEKMIGKDKRNENISARYDSSFGIELEIIISSHAAWGLDLFNTTGSKSHVGAIKKLAVSKNINLNDLLNAGNLKDFTDKAVYDILGLEYIEPELRENKGEIEMAQAFRLPKLVKVEDIKGDLHIHSSWSDGIIEFDELLDKCRTYNYSYFAITDHSASNMYGNGLSSERLLEKMAYIEELKTRVKEPAVLFGGEVDIIGEGRLDYNDELLKQIDFVLGSMHSNYLNTKDENTKKVIGAIKNKYVDAVAHPTGVVFGARAPYGLEMEKIFEAAVEYGKALEINSYLLRLDLNDEYARQLKDMGGKFVIDTDSHRVDNLDMIKLGVDVARRAGLEKDDVINTMELEELKKWKVKRISK